MDTWKINEWKRRGGNHLNPWIKAMVSALHLTPWSCLSLERNNSAGCQEIFIILWNQNAYATELMFII